MSLPPAVTSNVQIPVLRCVPTSTLSTHIHTLHSARRLNLMPFVLRFTSDRKPFTALEIQRGIDRIESTTNRVHTVRWTPRVFEVEFDNRKELNEHWHELFTGLGHDLGSWTFKTYKSKD